MLKILIFDIFYVEKKKGELFVKIALKACMYVYQKYHCAFLNCKTRTMVSMLKNLQILPIQKQ